MAVHDKATLENGKVELRFGELENRRRVPQLSGSGSIAWYMLGNSFDAWLAHAGRAHE